MQSFEIFFKCTQPLPVHAQLVAYKFLKVILFFFLHIFEKLVKQSNFTLKLYLLMVRDFLHSNLFITILK